MALILKNSYQVTIPVDKIRVKDTTGEYDASSNVGGWGTPNTELSEIALWAIVVRKAVSGDEYLSPVTNNFVYDPTASNDKQTTIEFLYSNDGVLNIYLGFLNVSEDGETYLIGGDPIEDGDFFYWANGGVYSWKRVDGDNEELTSVEIIENEDISRVLCSDLVAARLAVQAQKIYKKYTIERVKNIDDAEPLFDEINKLQTDIQGAYYTFASNLSSQAQSQIETLLDSYQLLTT